MNTKPSTVNRCKNIFLCFTDTFNAILDIVAIVTPYSDTFGLFSTAVMDDKQIVFLM